MAITVKNITFDKIKELGKKFGYIDIKGWSMSDVNECFREYCRGSWDSSDYINKEFEFENEKDLYVCLTDAIQEWKDQAEYGEMMQQQAMHDDGWC
jgi:hypothetical protein